MHWLILFKYTMLSLTFVVIGMVLLLSKIYVNETKSDIELGVYSKLRPVNDQAIQLLKRNNTTAANLNDSTPNRVIVNSIDGLKHILLWNAFFNHADYGVGFGTAVFDSTSCSRRCYITNELALMKSAEAVVVHTFNMAKRHKGQAFPARQFRDQLFIFFLRESQLRSYRGLSSSEYFTDKFNLTFTFLRSPDTDVYAPLGYFEINDTPQPESVPRLNTLATKTDLAFWVVSNCRAPSSRWSYAEALAKYIDIDIYGECGNNTCLKRSSCFNQLQERYMFYLAFENSYCQDYITEKAFRALTWTKHVVPVVLGGGNYTRDLPPHSFIDVRDFDSPQSLSEYMIYLKGNLTAYREYFQWKESFRIVSEIHIIKKGFCRLCEILHMEHYPYKTHFNAIEYWSPAKQCLKGDDERNAVHLS